ncbi:DNA-binding protein [Pseudomonas monteilii]|uniref:DNA-binding protein n=2 Tax=Pseudomonas monteilii TaxID=76759 RepID=UPI001E419B4F|nr:DNA-binding protein [Pseudomonas monteilii]MCE0929596.1 DNA-binding protein [Pseudomonas monteilii]MCE1015790.1 DNA-binding protein [Pseudomonas monteilii]MCE1044477.1 DNA-binding protein [Pseudomonas monteilii]WJO35744.1 DNA-binding protein [Pseudomonas monteilii]WJR47622.1 DNA-binding protein [Pseudomonas monteilii]
MARGGINLALVRRAREALVARGQNPSIDAIRIELGNTGSKTTIQRYLKEIEAHDPRPSASPSRLSDELTELVGKMLERLLEEGNEALAHERASFDLERQAMKQEVGTLQIQLNQANDEVAKLQSALQTQDEELKTTHSSLQAELTRNARLSQSCTDLEVRVQEKDGQIQSLEQKHAHAREALEHYRASVKEQREQDLSRHESQVYQMQQELTVIQQTLMVKQEEISRLIRDNERLIGESRQQTKEVSQQRDAIERLKGDLGIANAAIARGEGAKELLTQQLEAKAKEVVEVRSDATVGQQRESELVKRLEEAEAALSTYRTAKEVDDPGR